jgi:uncharacterized protein
MTEGCNLACSYCYEHHKSKTRMPVQTAIQAITDAFGENDYDELEINFFGGEPLLEFANIAQICEWLWATEWPKPYICFASTNGTLVHESVVSWFRENRHRFILGLSLDGTEAMHNKNRSNSFARIDVPLFRELWPFQPIKMTVSKETLPSLAEGVMCLHQAGFKVNCNLAHGIEWSSEDCTTLSRELRTLITYYIENPCILPSSIAAMDVFRLCAQRKAVPNYCGAGSAIRCVDVRGKLFPCQTFMPTSTGSAIDSQGMFAALDCSDNLDPRCVSCVLFPACPTCYGLNYLQFGNPFFRNTSQCAIQKVRARASAYMASQMLTHRERGYAWIREWSQSDMVRAAKSIQLVHDSVAL